MALGHEGGAGGGGIGALPRARLGRGAGQGIEPGEHLILVQADRARGGAGLRLLPFGQLGKEPALRLPGPGDARRDQRRPGPAQPVQRLRRGPAALALQPVGRIQPIEQQRRGLLQQRGNIALLRRRRQVQRRRQPFGRGHQEARGMQKGPEFEQVQPVEFMIAQPLPGQRRIEQQHRRFGRARDRLPLGQAQGAAMFAQPYAAMAGVKRGQGCRIDHPPGLEEREQKENLFQRGFSPGVVRTRHRHACAAGRVPARAAPNARDPAVPAAARRPADRESGCPSGLPQTSAPCRK